MKNQILLLAALPLISAGCIVVDSTGRSDRVQPSYGSPSDQSPAPVAPAASDDPYPVLDAYGNWIDVGDYGRVWQPAVASDWRPYSNGQWVWTDSGWMWDSDEPVRLGRVSLRRVDADACAGLGLDPGVRLVSRARRLVRGRLRRLGADGSPARIVSGGISARGGKVTGRWCPPRSLQG